MDNCPAGQYFGGLNRTGQICRLTNNWQINGGAGAWGVMFDLVNTSGGQLNLQEVSWLPIAANITHNIYYRTAPGPHAPKTKQRRVHGPCVLAEYQIEEDNSLV
ncbi:MAG: hypothetical protein IPK61_15345 [Saprospiraceae bacterium]|nr:hypothetical protein [Saprospiraceae bacterium]